MNINCGSGGEAPPFHRNDLVFTNVKKKGWVSIKTEIQDVFIRESKILSINCVDKVEPVFDHVWLSKSDTLIIDFS